MRSVMLQINEYDDDDDILLSILPITTIFRIISPHHTAKSPKTIISSRLGSAYILPNYLPCL